MCYFQDFFVIQILREINFGECGSAKNAFFDIFEALNWVVFGKKSKIIASKCAKRPILHCSKGEIYQVNQFRVPKIAKNAVLERPDSPQLISRKI